MALTASKIEQLIEELSIASLRSWLKAQGFQHSANTKEEMVQRILKLHKKNAISEEQFEAAVSNIEEASGKRVMLFQVGDDQLKALAAETFEEHLAELGAKPATKAVRAPRLPSNPTRVYVTLVDGQIRAKWAETQTRIDADYHSLEFVKRKVTRIVVMVANMKSGFVELRYDKPEIRHIHNNNAEQYFKFYKELAEKLLGVNLARFEIRDALRSLVETEPRVVRIRVNQHRSKTDKAVRFVDRKGLSDVRDDAEWKAALAAGGTTRVYDDQAVYWVPAASNGLLSREVFTDIDAVTSTVRMDADCHEGEIEYAVSTIRAHQIKPSASSSPA